MIVKKGTVERLYYIEKDHLGSIIGLINSTGSYAERHSYDPWGRQRNPTNWSYDSITELKLTSLGYTGQEHLDMFGLINMNGRVYDPLISRFLNVDPIIQNPYSSHDLNNYSYCIIGDALIF
jgi:RHS repeat-associated protein